jgi:hypothetical protein
MNLPNFENEINILHKKMSEIWNPLIIDGITNTERYFNSRERILWILKEANESKGENAPKDHRDFHKDVTTYKDWQKTFPNIINSSYGILNNIYDFSKIPKIGTLHKPNKLLTNITNDIAIININKSGGGSRCKTKISHEYTLNKTILLKQIELLKPTVVINATQVSNIHNDLSSGMAKNFIDEKNGCKYLLKNKTLLIDSYHPNNTEMSHKNYFECIINAYLKTRVNI